MEDARGGVGAGSVACVTLTFDIESQSDYTLCVTSESSRAEPSLARLGRASSRAEPSLAKARLE
jgi:hypothetical protein